ncbi:MAG: hypothetical protein LCH73_09000 [Proteobacteria bacterium]|nr:hypothetical protein [Pseudomonadota bacterium]
MDKRNTLARCGVRLGMLAALVAGLAGCAGMGLQHELTPTPLHRQDAPGAGELPADAQARSQEEALARQSYQASADVALAYFAALQKAKANPDGKADVANYVRQGVALVQLHCVRWFGRIEARQQRSELDTSNYNVISNLGTALLGLGGASEALTAGYGALGVAWTGFNANIGSAYLAAPNAANVKRLTLDAVDSRAAQLLGTAPKPQMPAHFADAYVALERLAGICTHAEVKRLTNKTVEQSKAEADENGDIKVFSEVGKADVRRIAPRTELLAAIDGLSDDEAMAAVRMLPGRGTEPVKAILLRQDKAQQRFKDPTAARQVMHTVLALDGGTSDERLAAWQSLLADH